MNFSEFAKITIESNHFAVNEDKKSTKQTGSYSTSMCTNEFAYEICILTFSQTNNPLSITSILKLRGCLHENWSEHWTWSFKAQGFENDTVTVFM